LRSAGLQKGDCVLIHSFNDIYYPILVLSIIGAGGIFAGSNPAYTPHELKHHVKVTQAKFLLSEPELLPSLLEAAKDTNIPDKNIWVFHTLPSQKVPDGMISWTELMQHGEQDWVRFDDLKTQSTTTAARLTSSGTTGLPKATISTHRNFIAQHQLVYGVLRDYEIVTLVPLPMFHAAIGPRVHTTVLKNGQVTYIMRRFEVEPYLQYIQKYQVTDLLLVTAMAIGLAMFLRQKKYSLETLKQVAVGAAALGKDTQAELRGHLNPGSSVIQVYGLTETTCLLTMFDYPNDDDTGSVGYVLPGMEVKLVDDAGKDISGYDVVGEMCVRGPTVVLGYFNDPEANRSSYDSDGFFHTGDVMYCDGKTKLWYVVDRKKELIKVRGFQVAPPEIEGILLTHRDIVDSAVIGIPVGGIDGELPRAYVVRRPGVKPEELTEKDVYEYASKILAKYKRLDGGVVFRDMIPKNASGKILKRILRDELKKEKIGAKL
jgi:acyl-CoA synthetase (AMP-forming)/AMP-acid ligase II